MCRVVTEAPSIRISTRPSQGPFKVGQTVHFTCEVEPAQEHGVTYRWRAVEDLYGFFTNTVESFSQTYHSNYTLHYCWYTCTVMLNGTVLGSADKLVEVLGKLAWQSLCICPDNVHSYIYIYIYTPST